MTDVMFLSDTMEETNEVAQSSIYAVEEVLRRLL